VNIIQTAPNNNAFCLSKAEGNYATERILFSDAVFEGIKHEGEVHSVVFPILLFFQSCKSASKF
jgi:hypothetical protein